MGGIVMIIKTPVEFDTIGTFMPDGKEHYWEKTNGLDNAKHRITNIVGHDGKQFKKLCPSCLKIKSVTEYGDKWRNTGGNYMRDQSQCIACRGMYN